MLKLHLRDNQKARRLTNQGTYEAVSDGEAPLNSQEWLMAHWRSLPAGEAGAETP
jgi:hypothetical protein